MNSNGELMRDKKEAAPGGGEAEVARIREAYARRAAAGKSGLYSVFNPAALFARQQREKEIVRLLAASGRADLSRSRILDLGCGTGGVLRDMIGYGAFPANCSGFDLLPDSIEAARRAGPGVDFRCGNAEELPYADGRYDIVILFTVLTSILDGRMKRRLAAEAMRVLAPGGCILYFDYIFDNPRNPDVRGVGRAELESLFPGAALRLKRTTLAPPLARAIAPRSQLLCQLLEMIPLLRTHYIGVIVK